MTDPHILGAITLMKDANLYVQRGAMATKEGNSAGAQHFFSVSKERIERAGRVLSRIKNPQLRASVEKEYTKAIKAWNNLSATSLGMSGLGADFPEDQKRLVMLAVAGIVGFKLLKQSINMGTLLALGGGAYLLYMKSQEPKLPPPSQQRPATSFANITDQASKLFQSVR